MSRFEDFIASRRSPGTKENYRRNILTISPDPDAFLSLAEKDRASAEMALISFFTKRKASGAYHRMRLAAVKSFLTFYDVELKWKKIVSVIPPARKVAADRAPTREEIGRLISKCDTRARFIVLSMASGGFRIGAWNWLRLQDARFLEDGIVALRIYRGEPEEYTAFITPEAGEELKEYLRMRKEAGEDLGPGSPLVRDKWDFDDFSKKVDVRIVKPLKSASVSSIIFRHWRMAGLRAPHSGGPRTWAQKEFKQAHGFRKFFKTYFPVCPDHGQLDAEILMGHYLNYYKPTEEHLLDVYRKAVPKLSIDEKFTLKEQLESEREEHKEGFKDLKLDYLTLKDELSEEKKERERMKATLNAILAHPSLAEKWRRHTTPPLSPSE